jgi:hypothetical protein
LIKYKGEDKFHNNTEHLVFDPTVQEFQTSICSINTLVSLDTFVTMLCC